MVYNQWRIHKENLEVFVSRYSAQKTRIFHMFIVPVATFFPFLGMKIGKFKRELSQCQVFSPEDNDF